VRRLVAVLLAGAVAGALAGASAATTVPKPRPAKPTARDRAAARQLANAADAFMSDIDTLESGTLVTVQSDYAACSANYANKVDAPRLTDLQSFLAEARATASIPRLWQKMVSRWDSLKVRNATLKLVVSVAHTQASQVQKLGQAPQQPAICDVLAGWEASGWSNSYVTDMEQAWSDAIPVDGNVIQAARARVQAVAPQLRELGLADAQIQTVLIAVL
jgi:hypothetical protein